MDFVLAPEARQAGYRIAFHQTLGSTNSEALDRGRHGDDGPLWVVTSHQTDGRGRRGNTWDTPQGNLAATLLLAVYRHNPLLATLGFVAGLALVRALECCAGPAGPVFKLKWPNDVLVEGAKLAGILLEAETRAGEGQRLAVGMGVNLVGSPAGMPYPGTSLARLGVSVTPIELFGRLSAAWVEAYALWDEGRGFARVREAWLARAHGIEAPVTVRSGARVIEGVFETIDDQGQLIVRGRGGARSSVPAGDVVFGHAATLRPEVQA